MIQKIWITIGGRKFIAYIIGLISIMYLTNKSVNIIGVLSPESIVSLVGLTFTNIIVLTGVYVGVNIAQKLVEQKKEIKNDESEN